MFAVYKDGRPVSAAQFSTREQCAAEILVRGWTEPVERFGVCWQKGVEVIEVAAPVQAIDTALQVKAIPGG